MRRLLPILLLLVVAGLGAVLFRQSGGRPEVPAKGQLSPADALGGDASAGYARALAPRPFHFPEDHGPHPDFRTEWWYFTGNLEDAAGRHFGYQLTFFRIAVAPRAPERSSAWATRQIYMAHFALTDAAGRSFRNFERFSRAAIGLAGAAAEPFRVWLEDWTAAGGESGLFPLRLQAGEGEVAMDLTLAAGKPVVPQGDQGLSRKSGEAGNASYYYSMPRLPTAGMLRIGGTHYKVRGLSWFDREWSTSSLGREDVGWDWFALQLGDGREVMFYRLRRTGGGVSPWSAGTLIEEDGSSRHLAPAEVEITVLDHWRSPHDGATYPARWRLRIPAGGIDLEIEPWLADQELQGTFRYWEGAVRLRGKSQERPVTGSGYVELTGYAGRP